MKSSLYIMFKYLSSLLIYQRYYRSAFMSRNLTAFNVVKIMLKQFSTFNTVPRFKKHTSTTIAAQQIGSTWTDCAFIPLTGHSW